MFDQASRVQCCGQPLSSAAADTLTFISICIASPSMHLQPLYRQLASSLDGVLICSESTSAVESVDSSTPQAAHVWTSLEQGTGPQVGCEHLAVVQVLQQSAINALCGDESTGMSVDRGNDQMQGVESSWAPAGSQDEILADASRTHVCPVVLLILIILIAQKFLFKSIILMVIIYYHA